MIEVIDNGKGIGEEHVGKILEPFYSTKPLGKGAGLGLSISYGIMQDNGGDLLVKSEESNGATFTMLFPNDAIKLS